MLNLDAQPPTQPPKPKRRQRMWIKPWIMERDNNGSHNTIMDDLNNTDMVSFRNYINFISNSKITFIELNLCKADSTALRTVSFIKNHESGK